MAKKAKIRVRQQAAQHKKNQQAKRWRIGLGVIGAILVIGFIVWAFRQGNATAAPGEHVAYQGQTHIEDGEAHTDYNSDPPTSGAHSGDPAPPGFYDTPLADENVVHSLEHGYIAISYDCNQLDDCESVKDSLRALVGKYNNFKIIAAPRTNRDAPIALTAWQRIELLDSYDEAAISVFINAWRNKGPEKTPN